MKKMKPEKQKISLIVDTREQQPYEFDLEKFRIVRMALPAGDYSLVGSAENVAVERKSLDDYVFSIIVCRERFKNELAILSTYDLGCVVVEGSMTDIVNHRYRGGVHPNSVFEATVACYVHYGVPVFFADDRQNSRRLTESILCRYHRDLAEANALGEAQ